MRHHFQRSFAAGAGLAFIASAAALVPSQALAQEVINACVGKATNTLRLLEPGSSCRSGEATVQWNVQGPQGPQGPTGPRGPAGPQTMLAAYVNGDGSIGVLRAPAGATLSVSHDAPGNYTINVAGLGTGCPLPTVTPFSPVVLSFTGGFCNAGVLQVGMTSNVGVDVPFMLHVIDVEQTNLKARALSGERVRLGP